MEKVQSEPVIASQTATLPGKPRPVVSIGAGGIVRDAHQPAYKIARFPVVAVYDLSRDKAEALARDFQIPRVCSSLAEAAATAPKDAVFDLALPAGAILGVLRELPDGAAVLMQKPMGETLDEARAIRDLCRAKHMVAAVNLQLRHAPYVIAARDLISRGVIGDLHDVEVRLTCHMPWQLWKFLFGLPRMEINYHSIHYIDLIRSFLGDPGGVWCKTVKHPQMMDLASTRTNIAMDYGDVIRANITTNHGHDFGSRHQESYAKFEGTKGAIKARLGVNLDYPRGLPDYLEVCVPRKGEESRWEEIPLQGSWFPHAFIGSMASVMRRANGETSELATSVEDAFKTMAVVEACYRSSERAATPIPQ